MGRAENVTFAEPKPEYPFVRVALGWAGAGGIIVGIGLGFWHVFHWLKYGVAVHYPGSQLLADLGLSYPQVTWVGVQRVLDWILSSPAAAGLFFGGMGLLGLCAKAINSHDEATRYWDDRKRVFEHRQEERAREARLRPGETD